MRLTRIAGEGIQSLANNKLRTFFMMAGTIVGVAALVVIMAIGHPLFTPTGKATKRPNRLAMVCEPNGRQDPRRGSIG